jgi:hypothetical protein
MHPMCITQSVCFTATGSLLAPIMDGTNLTQTSLIGKYLGRVLYREEHNLCDNLTAQGQSCPIPVGTTSLKTCFSIHPNYPADVSEGPIFSTKSKTLQSRVR